MTDMAREVCRAYASLQAGCDLQALGNHGGFSRAQIWKVTSTNGQVFCLKAWPRHGSDPRHIACIHDLIERASRTLSFIPRVVKDRQCRSMVYSGGRLWELAAWMPGVADFHARPSSTRLRAAFETLSELHHAWSSARPSMGTCPGILRRLELLAQWERFPGPQVEAALKEVASQELRELLTDAWHLLRSSFHVLGRVLEPWTEVALPLQPCHGDLWHDHVLFTGDIVTGIVDFESVKQDHVAVDVARLIGSLVEDQAESRELAVEAYARRHPLSAKERQLVNVLDWTGAVLSAAKWVRWVCLEHRCFEDCHRVTKRIASLLTRLRKQNAAGLWPAASGLHSAGFGI